MLASEHAFSPYFGKCRSSLDRLAQNSQWTSAEHKQGTLLIARHLRDLKKLLRTSSHEDQQKNQADRQTVRILKSFAGRFCGELFRVSKFPAKHSEYSSISWSDFERLVRKSPLVTGKADCVIYYRTRKASGGQRVIANLGKRVRAAQYHMQQVLTARHYLNNQDFNSPGLGREKALLSIQALIENDVEYFVVFDIENYFPSVKPKHLKQLRLPRNAVETVLFLSEVSLVICKGMKAKSARQGLPQGAPASAQIASALLGQEIRQLGGNLASVTYVDDGVIGASSLVEAQAVAKALTKRLADLPGGPIGLKFIKVCHATKGFEFLGYWIKALKKQEGVKAVFWPNHSSREKFKRNLFHRLKKKDGSALSADKCIEVMRAYREKWVQSFPLWAPSSEGFMEFVIQTECWVYDYLNGATKKIKPMFAETIGVANS